MDKCIFFQAVLNKVDIIYSELHLFFVKDIA